MCIFYESDRHGISACQKSAWRKVFFFFRKPFSNFKKMLWAAEKRLVVAVQKALWTSLKTRFTPYNVKQTLAASKKDNKCERSLRGQKSVSCSVFSAAWIYTFRVPYNNWPNPHYFQSVALSFTHSGNGDRAPSLQIHWLQINFWFSFQISRVSSRL